MALKYHPDKNQGSKISETHFKEILEAYSIIGDAQKRVNYDDERWRAGLGNSTNQVYEVTPTWLLKICKELNGSLITMDQNSISFSALQNYIQLILSPGHMDILLAKGDTETNCLIVNELLAASKWLKPKYLLEINPLLVQLAQDEPNLLAEINSTYEQIKIIDKRERLQPYLIIIITLLLCIFIYIYGRI